MKKLIEKIEKIIEDSQNNIATSTLKKDKDGSSIIAPDMVSLIETKIDDNIAINPAKNGKYAIELIKSLNNKYPYLSEIFDVKDVFKVFCKKFYFIESQHSHLLLKKCFDFKHNVKRSEKISDFYKLFGEFSLYNSDLENIIITIVLIAYSKYHNIQEVEKRIEKYMLSEEFENWIENCKKNINRYTDVSKLCSNGFGEVFTNDKLIIQLIELLPKFSKDMKILDPCGGIGNFPIHLINRIMIDLEDEIPNEEERKKHILNNMLVQCELQVKNAFINYYILDPINLYDLKMFRGSFLNDKNDDINPDFIEKCKEWGVDKFDIIIGNPPYNADQKVNGKKGGGDMLWDKFVKCSLKILNENKYLVFVHPAAWRKPESENSKNNGLFKLMTQDNQMLYLEIHDSKDGKKAFGDKIGTRYDFYCIQKCKKYKETKIKDELGQVYDVDLGNFKFLPNYNVYGIDKLLGEGCEIIYNRTNYGSDKEYTSENKHDEFIYPLIHSTPMNGVRYYYSSRNDKGHFGIPKIIFGDSGIYHTIIDINGEYGMTQHSMAIKIDSDMDIELLDKVLKSSKFHNILKSCSWSNFQIDWRLFLYFKKHWYKEINIDDEPINLEKSVGSSIKQENFIFKINETYEYSGTSKKLKSKDVKIISINEDKFKVKDTYGNIAMVSKTKLQIKN